jgi:hypothetical protein
MWPSLRPLNDTLRASVIDVLGTAAFTQAAAEGNRMRIPDAFSYALDATAEGAPVTSAPIPVAPWDRPGAPTHLPWWTGVPPSHTTGPGEADAATQA